MHKPCQALGGVRKREIIQGWIILIAAMVVVVHILKKVKRKKKRKETSQDDMRTRKTHKKEKGWKAALDNMHIHSVLGKP